MCAYCQRLLKYVHPYVHSFGSKKRIVMFYRVAVSLYCLAGTFLEFQSWHLPASGSPMTFSVDLSLVFFSSWPSNRKFIASCQLLMWFTSVWKSGLLLNSCLKGTEVLGFMPECSLLTELNPPTPISKIPGSVAHEHVRFQVKRLFICSWHISYILGCLLVISQVSL